MLTIILNTNILMYNYLALLFLLISFSGLSQEKQWLNSNFEKTRKKNGVFYAVYEKDGINRKESIYSQSNQLFKIFNYQNDVLNGAYKIFFYDGTVREEGVYKYGVKEGEVITYSPNGDFFNKENYKEGELSGLCVRNFYGTNKIKDSSYYLNGKREGVSYFFDKEEGYIDSKYYFSEDKRDGVGLTFYSSGKVKDSSFYIKGTIQKASYVFHENGSLKSKHPYEGGKINGIVISYSDSGKIIDSAFYINGKKNGHTKSRGSKGNLLSSQYYIDGKKEGSSVEYWPNGSVKRKSIYEEGKLTIDSCFLENGSYTECEVSNEIFYVVETMPSFSNGGEEKLYEFLGKNIRYPQGAKEFGTQGRVYVQFVIEKTGDVVDIEVVKGIGDGCDKESLRVVKAMPKWNPGYQRGKPVRVKYTLPIVYRLM